MKHYNIGMRALRASLLACVLNLIASAGVGAALVYEVTLQTTSVDGAAGYIDLQFIAGGAAPSASATFSLLGLGGGSLSASEPPVVDGDVSGALPGELEFGNSGGFNAVLQPLVFGQSLHFLVAFGGDFLTATSDFGTTFSVGLLDSEFNYLPLPPAGGTGGPIAGPAVSFDLSSDGESDGVVYSLATTGNVTPVPEPQAWLLLAAGLLGLASITRNTRRPAR